MRVAAGRRRKLPLAHAEAISAIDLCVDVKEPLKARWSPTLARCRQGRYFWMDNVREPARCNTVNSAERG